MMKKEIVTRIVFVLFILIGLSINNYSQTVVQWYTSMGDFRAQLREDLVPVTAQNFIDLSDAEFYDDLIFHRVISGFMIQDGCPNGNGTGGPGYSFDDEFYPDLRHDEPGILSMANSGANTNGSQYFITVAPTSWLDDAHAVFGKIIDGMDVVYAISEVETYSNDKPIIDVVIDSIRVVTGEPEIELIAPSSNNLWNYEVVHEITWSSAFIADVKIEFTSDNGQTWEVVTDTYSAHYRSFDWELPNIISEECFIRISDVANSDVVSINEEPFSICSFDLEYPNGFETFMNDIAVPITWSTELVNDVLSIYYQLEENGDYIPIVDGIPASDQSYIWYPDIATDWCKISMSITQYWGVYDVSEFRFFIYALDLQAPMGGDDLEGNTVYQIEWEGEVIPEVKIEFSSDNGITWELIENNVNIDESPYDWEVPNIDASDCFIRLSVPNDPSLFKSNTTAFSIHKAVGIETYDLSDELNFNIYPNPVDEKVFVSFCKPESWAKDNIFEIYNSRGQLVLSKTESLNSLGNQDVIIDVQELPQGLYLLKIVIGEKNISQKFIKR